MMIDETPDAGYMNSSEVASPGGFRMTVFSHSEDVLRVAISEIQAQLNERGINVRFDVQFLARTPNEVEPEDLFLRVAMQIPPQTTSERLAS